MAEVGVHDDDVVMEGHGEAGEDGGGKAAVFGADEIAELGVACGELVEDVFCRIRRVVVDNNDFPEPVSGTHGGGELGDEDGEVLGFFESRNDNGDAGDEGVGCGHESYLIRVARATRLADIDNACARWSGNIVTTAWDSR